jgi:hypothetical protein
VVVQDLLKPNLPIEELYRLQGRAKLLRALQYLPQEIDKELERILHQEEIAQIEAEREKNANGRARIY